MAYKLHEQVKDTCGQIICEGRTLQQVLDDHELWVESNERRGKQAILRCADLRRVELSYANLRRASLIGADLGRAILHCIDLRWANLSDANLSRTDLSKADLSEARLRCAFLFKSDLSGANVFKTQLHGAEGLTEEQIALATKQGAIIEKKGAL